MLFELCKKSSWFVNSETTFFVWSYKILCVFFEIIKTNTSYQLLTHVQVYEQLKLITYLLTPQPEHKEHMKSNVFLRERQQSVSQASEFMNFTEYLSDLQFSERQNTHLLYLDLSNAYLSFFSGGSWWSYSARVRQSS